MQKDDLYKNNLFFSSCLYNIIVEKGDRFHAVLDLHVQGDDIGTTKGEKHFSVGHSNTPSKCYLKSS